VKKYFDIEGIFLLCEREGSIAYQSAKNVTVVEVEYGGGERKGANEKRA
jgi:hypothetical protein